MTPSRFVVSFALVRAIALLAFGDAIGAHVGRGFAVAGEGRAFCQEAFGGGAVQVEALGLKNGAFVPFDAEPFKPVENSLDEFGAVALDVGVFNSQHQRAAFVAGEKPIEQRCARTADVKISGGRGSESHARLFRGGHFVGIPSFCCVVFILAKGAVKIERGARRPRHKFWYVCTVDRAVKGPHSYRHARICAMNMRAPIGCGCDGDPKVYREERARLPPEDANYFCYPRKFAQR